MLRVLGANVISVPVKFMMTIKTALESRLGLLLHNDELLQARRLMFIPSCLSPRCGAGLQFPLVPLLLDRSCAFSFQKLPSAVLALHILIEKYNLQSFWTPYLNSLPKALTPSLLSFPFLFNSFFLVSFPFLTRVP